MSTLPYNTPITSSRRTAIEACYSALEEQFEHLIALGTKKRRRMSKLGFKTSTFARRALDIGKQHQGILPRNMDLEQIESDFATWETLLIQIARTQMLLQRLQDTAVQIGHDVYEETRRIYTYLQTSGEGEGLQAALEELGQMFARPKRKKKVQAEVATVAPSTAPAPSPSALAVPASPGDPRTADPEKAPGTGKRASEPLDSKLAGTSQERNAEQIFLHRGAEAPARPSLDPTAQPAGAGLPRYLPGDRRSVC